MSNRRNADPGCRRRGISFHSTTWLQAHFVSRSKGKSRAVSDPDRLHVLSELLHPIARRMSRVEGDDVTNAQNIVHVVDHLDLYEREFTLIVQARLASRAGIA